MFELIGKYYHNKLSQNFGTNDVSSTEDIISTDDVILTYDITSINVN